jgi:hypothetical protein
MRANGMGVIGCKVEGFGGNGIHVLSGQDGSPFVVDGQNNANAWYVERTRCANNKTHGFYAEGIDSNAGVAVMLDCSGNTGAGIYDNCSFGNTYVGPHVEGNVAVAIRCGAGGGYARFLGVYKEGDTYPAVLIDSGNAGKNVIDFRVLVANIGETITDNSGAGDNVIVTSSGFMKQNRLLIGTGSATSLTLESAGSTIFFGSAQDVSLSRGGTDILLLGADDCIEFDERGGDIAAPGANAARLYARDNGSGKTQICVRFPTGAVQVLATEP